MTIAFLDDQMIKRDRARGAVHVPGMHAPRRPLSPRVAGRPPTTQAFSLDAVEWPTRASVHRLPVALEVPAAVVAARPRLTPRGRLVFGSLLVLVVLVVFSLGRFSAGAAAAGPPLHVTVQAGDTLWSIARQAVPNSDPRDEVARIVSVNHLTDGADLTPGADLLLPRG